MPSDIRIACFIEPNFGENAYLIWRREGGPCWIVDPGLPPSAAQICEHVRKLDLKPDAILLTHGHMDHIAGVPEVLEEFDGLKVHIAEQDRAALTDPRENLSTDVGVPTSIGLATSHDLASGAELTLDGAVWQVLDTSGHSPGGRSLYCPAEGMVIVGDALFAGSIGRTDFHHSDPERLIRNIHERLLTLPPETRVYSGHGPATTIGEEKRANPFLQGGERI